MNEKSLSHPGIGIASPASAWWKSKPPLPPEHGAWVMLYAPLVIGCIAAYTPWPTALLLTLVVTGLFLSRNVAGLLFRHRAKPGMAEWLLVYLALALTGALSLLAMVGFSALLQIAVPALVMFGSYSALSFWPTAKGKGRRLDRSQWGEVLGAGALALTAPAAAVVTHGQFDGFAWCLWIATTLFFISGVFHVEMLLSVAKVKTELKPADRWRIGRDSIVYHFLLAIVVAFIARHLGGTAGWLTIAAYAPVVVRGLWAALHLSNQLPSLKRVGLVETAYALWFTGCFIAAVR